MARLQDAEIAHYRSEGWVIPRYRLPAARIALMAAALETLLRDLRPSDGQTGVPVNFARRPLWLLKGVDRSGRNDFKIGHAR